MGVNGCDGWCGGWRVCLCWFVHAHHHLYTCLPPSPLPPSPLPPSPPLPSPFIPPPPFISPPLHPPQSVRITLLEVFASNSGQGLKHTTLVQKHIDLPEQGSVVALTWVGKKLIAATGMRYLLVDPVTHIFGSICEFHEDDLTPVMLQPLPASQQAVLLMVGVGWGGCLGVGGCSWCLVCLVVVVVGVVVFAFCWVCVGVMFFHVLHICVYVCM